MKYWAYINGEVPGSYEPAELVRLAGFTAATMVCPADGDPAAQHWQRAAIYGDIAAAIGEHSGGAAAVPNPLPSPFSPQDILDETSQRLYRHVSDLMRDLENQREERALNQSLQRSLLQAQNELLRAQERVRALEERAALIPELEDRENKLRELLGKARADLQERDKLSEELQSELNAATKTSARSASEKERLAKLTEDLSQQLAQKDLSLNKSLDVLRRLEAQVGKFLLPAASRPNDPPPAIPADSATTQPKAIAPQPVLPSPETPAALHSLPAIDDAIGQNPPVPPSVAARNIVEIPSERPLWIRALDRCVSFLNAAFNPPPSS